MNASPRPRPTWRFRLVAALLIGVLALLRWRIRTEGLEHVPARGGAVIAWNHHSHLDVVVTAYDVYRRLGRPCRPLALRELWAHPGLWWLPRLVDAVPVDRRSRGARARSLRAAVAALRDGHLVLVAPEGRISPGPELEPFRPGAARMAQAAGVPLVPSVSWGTQRFSTTGRRVSLREGVGLAVTVRFGAPIEVGPDDDVREVTQVLRARMAAMLDAVRRDQQEDRPPDDA